MEKIYRSILNSLPDIVYQVDGNGNFIFLNESVEKLGYDRDMLMDCHFSMIIHPDDIARVNRELFLDGVKDVPGSLTARGFFNERRTGERITKRLKVRLLYSGSRDEFRNGEIFATGYYRSEAGERAYVGTVGVVRDITDDSTRAQSIVKVEKFYRQLIDSSFEIIMVITLDGTVLYCSSSVKRNLGKDDMDIIGENLSVILHPDDDFIVKQYINDVKPGETHRRIELRFQHLDGAYRYFETSLEGIKDRVNEYTMCYILHASDITERKKIETALEKREKVYRTLLQLSPDAIIIFDSDGDMIMVNDMASSILGSFREELLGRDFFSFIMEPDDISEPDIKKRILSSEVLHEVVLQVKTRKGQILHIELSVSSIQENEGPADSYIAIFRDITRRRIDEIEKMRLEKELLGIIINRLSRREIELLQYIATGYQWPRYKRQIGKMMDVLPGTLDSFVMRIKKKTGMDEIQKIARIASLRYNWDDTFDEQEL